VAGRPTSRRPAPVRAIKVGQEVLTTSGVSAELQDYVDVLIGRSRPPEDFGEMTLFEIASAYLARALEIKMCLHRAEREGLVKRGEAFYRFRTGELEDFIELAKNACDLGSRRITYLQMQHPS
jgi:hypothetical protein